MKINRIISTKYWPLSASWRLCWMKNVKKKIRICKTKIKLKNNNKYSIPFRQFWSRGAKFVPKSVMTVDKREVEVFDHEFSENHDHNFQ